MSPPPPGWKNYLWQALLLGIVGVAVPFQLGVQFLDPVVLGAYVCMGAILAAPMAALAGEVQRPVILSMAMGWASVVLGILTIYASRNVVVGPNVITLGVCAWFGAMLTLAVTSGVALAYRVGSPGVARLVARALQLALLLLFYLKSRSLPDVAAVGGWILVVPSILFGWLLRR